MAKRNIGIRVDEAILASLDRRAKELKRSRNWLISEILEESSIERPETSVTLKITPEKVKTAEAFLSQLTAPTASPVAPETPQVTPPVKTPEEVEAEQRMLNDLNRWLESRVDMPDWKSVQMYEEMITLHGQKFAKAALPFLYRK